MLPEPAFIAGTCNMELREWAVRIIQATSLEEKLADPGDLTDENPGTAMASPDQPGRPDGLIFKRADHSDSGFPGIHRIENEVDRGRLLHFFANHELLATELMALVLLRFPEAPAAFRVGVARTLRDEQRHTTWYMNRMRELGIQFGELPVSGYFWRSVASMETPLDFVSRLSLTFEQANLDYCRQFAALFSKVGDAASAGILDRIYKDEIAHVAHGLKWFRRWKRSGETDWDAFCRQLKFPLSPARAKGVHFNSEGRRAAGLSPEFIDALKVSAQSKGRTPTVWWFNPLAEGYIRLGNAFTPGKKQAALLQDLSALPQFLARSGDIVLTPKKPSNPFLAQLAEAGFDLPEWVEMDATRAGPIPELAGRKLGGLRPWAWSPESLALMEPLRPQVTDTCRATPPSPERCYPLFAKSWSTSLLRRLVERVTNVPGLCPQEMVGTTVNSTSETWAAIRLYREMGYHRLVVKQSLGMAGDQTIRLWEPEPLPQQIRWIERTLESGCQLVVEPWLDRLADFSVQFEMVGQQLRMVGHTELICDQRGHYQGNRVGIDCGKRLPLPVRRLAPHREGGASTWQLVFDQLQEMLESELQALGFQGAAGIDAFVYRASDGVPRLKPLVELNPRHTMGRVALELHRRAAPGSFTVFRILRRSGLKRDGFPSLESYAQHLRQSSPLELSGAPVARIVRGAVALNDSTVAQEYLAVAEYGRPS